MVDATRASLLAEAVTETDGAMRWHALNCSILHLARHDARIRATGAERHIAMTCTGHALDQIDLAANLNVILAGHEYEMRA